MRKTLFLTHRKHDNEIWSQIKLPEKFTSLGKKFPFVASDGRDFFLEKELRVSVFHEIGFDTTCTGSKEALCRKQPSQFLTVAGNSKRNLLCYLTVLNNFALWNRYFGFVDFFFFKTLRSVFFISSPFRWQNHDRWPPSTYITCTKEQKEIFKQKRLPSEGFCFGFKVLNIMLW